MATYCRHALVPVALRVVSAVCQILVMIFYKFCFRCINRLKAFDCRHFVYFLGKYVNFYHCRLNDRYCILSSATDANDALVHCELVNSSASNVKFHLAALPPLVRF